jgi:hypothetical protein
MKGTIALEEHLSTSLNNGHRGAAPEAERGRR